MGKNAGDQTIWTLWLQPYEEMALEKNKIKIEGKPKYHSSFSDSSVSSSAFYKSYNLTPFWKQANRSASD